MSLVQSPEGKGRVVNLRGGPRGRVRSNHSGSRLRWIRLDAGWNPSKLAGLIRQAGRDLGKPNECTPQLIREWEDGALAHCDPVYHAALEKVTGMGFDLLVSPWAKLAIAPAAALIAAVESERPMPPSVPFGVLLRQWREKRGISQTEMAEFVQRYGKTIGEINGCSKRLVQKWESGAHAAVQPTYVRILSSLTGISAASFNPRRIEPLPNVSVAPPDSVLELVDSFISQLNRIRIMLITGSSDGDDRLSP